MNQYSFLPVVGMILVLAFGGNAQDSSTQTRLSALSNGINQVVDKYVAAATKGVNLPVGNKESLTTPFVTLPGNVSLAAGLITLPLDFLCQQPKDGVLDLAVCHVCSLDCTFVHNKYGGQCGMASDPMPGTPQANGQVCVCNDTPSSPDFANPSATCGTMASPALDATIDLAINVVLRQRMIALQCPPIKLGLGSGSLLQYNHAGCFTDCTANHNYRNGTCQKTTAVATFPTETAVNFNCDCSH